MTEYTAFPLIERLKTTLTSRPPYCSGVLEVAPRNFELYYGRNEAQCVIYSLQDDCLLTIFPQIHRSAGSNDIE